jgi:hypothetical protein
MGDPEKWASIAERVAGSPSTGRVTARPGRTFCGNSSGDPVPLQSAFNGSFGIAKPVGDLSVRQTPTAEVGELAAMDVIDETGVVE